MPTFFPACLSEFPDASPTVASIIYSSVRNQELNVLLIVVYMKWKNIGSFGQTHYKFYCLNNSTKSSWILLLFDYFLVTFNWLDYLCHIACTSLTLNRSMSQSFTPWCIVWLRFSMVIKIIKYFQRECHLISSFSCLCHYGKSWFPMLLETEAITWAHSQPPWIYVFDIHFLCMCLIGTPVICYINHEDWQWWVSPTRHLVNYLLTLCFLNKIGTQNDKIVHAINKLVTRVKNSYKNYIQ